MKASEQLATLRTLGTLPDGSRLGWLPADGASAALTSAIEAHGYDPARVLSAIERGGEFECVAVGPAVVLERGSKRKGESHASFFWHDVGRDRLLLAISAVTMPELWLEVAPTAEGMLAGFRSLRPEGPRQIFRAFYGVMEGGVEAFIQLENALIIHACTEGDPLRIGTIPTEGEEDVFDALSHESHFETRFSKSHLFFTAFHHAVQGETGVVLELEYTPASHQAAVSSWNETYGTTWPLDVPVDVLPCCYGGQIWSMGHITQALAEAPNGMWLQAGALLQNCAEQGALEQFLRAYQKHAEFTVRCAVAETAHAFGLKPILSEMLAVEDDDRLRGMIESVI